MQITKNLVFAIALVIIIIIAIAAAVVAMSLPAVVLEVEEEKEGFTAASPTITITMQFCGGERAVEQMVHNTPGFIERLDNTANLSIRGCNTVDEYLSRYGEGIMETVPDRHQTKLREVYTSLMEQQVDKQRHLLQEVFEVDGLVPFLQGIPSPFYVALSEGKQSENGYAHTVGDTVVLPRSAVEQQTVNQLAKLLAHELVHVYQRYNPDSADTIVTQSYGFFEDHSLYEKGYRLRANPDTNAKLYSLESAKMESANEKESANPVLLGGGTQDFSDIVYLPSRQGYPTKFPWARNPEHPFEIMAEHVAEHCCRRQLP